MGKTRTIYYGGVMLALGALVLATVSATNIIQTVDPRSNANQDNLYHPQGKLEVVKDELCSISGWAVDMDNPGHKSLIRVYLDKSYSEELTERGALVGEYTADISRADIGEKLMIGANHGFAIDFRSTNRVPKDGQPHQLYVYAVDANDTSQLQLLVNSPATITCSN